MFHLQFLVILCAQPSLAKVGAKETPGNGKLEFKTMLIKDFLVDN
jgi:hypothetical protein